VSSARHRLRIDYDDSRDEYDIRFDTINLYLRAKSPTVDMAIPELIKQAVDRDKASVALGKDDPQYEKLVRSVIGRVCLGWLACMTKEQAQEVKREVDAGNIWTPNG
jgi:hypothetical protein